ncbi:hypothetical protein EVAR_7076_1 [Eumeta japonica]|uniref:Uncharacterized protein n=1 Tax=Eumeta variegata TaxID=151549 RepID=A0A4C1XA85_EUMVA|nr:hypothetical protein EVAR_7076_1 [Eumeta japonica]
MNSVRPIFAIRNQDFNPNRYSDLNVNLNQSNNSDPDLEYLCSRQRSWRAHTSRAGGRQAGARGARGARPSAGGGGSVVSAKRTPRRVLTTPFC